MQPHDEELIDAMVTDARALHEMLRGHSLFTITGALALSILEHDPRVPAAISYLVSVARVLAKRLPIEQQTAVRWHLSETLSELESRWH